jgi:hypothetical protein
MQIASSISYSPPIGSDIKTVAQFNGGVRLEALLDKNRA